MARVYKSLIVLVKKYPDQIPQFDLLYLHVLEYGLLDGSKPEVWVCVGGSTAGWVGGWGGTHDWKVNMRS